MIDNVHIVTDPATGIYVPDGSKASACVWHVINIPLKQETLQLYWKFGELGNNRKITNSQSHGHTYTPEEVGHDFRGICI